MMAGRPVIVVPILLVAGVLMAPTAAAAAGDHRCAPIAADGTTFKVRVVAGDVRCGTARWVIRYVLRKGNPTQGSPGKAPGWRCAWSYGRRGRYSGRTGAKCHSGNRVVEGIQRSYAFLPRAAATGAGASAVRDCHVYAYFPSVLISSARNMTCGQAKREMRRYKDRIFRTFTTPGGFYCHRVSGGTYGGQWRCKRGRQAFRFEFSD